MSLDLFKATQPYEYYLKFIKKNCRPDSRKLNDIRPCQVNFDCINTANGSALVKLGNTSVLCGIKARVTKPREDRADRGICVCNVEIPALCSAKNFRTSSSYQASSFLASSVTSASIEQTQAMLSQLMQDILVETKCVDERDLCIRVGHLVWVVYIDLICLNNDGNLPDACCMAMISALKTLKLYEMEWNEQTSEPVLKYPICLRRLNMLNEPVSTTVFAIEDNILLSDPNKQEEDFMRTYMIIVTLDNKTVCLMRKYGGFSLKHDQVGLCLKRALVNGEYLRKRIYSLYTNTAEPLDPISSQRVETLTPESTESQPSEMMVE